MPKLEWTSAPYEYSERERSALEAAGIRPASGVVQWDLRWGRHSVATVWSTGTWHTWDRLHTGGENASEPTIERAKRAALIALVRQNDRPYRDWARHSTRCAAAIQRECALYVSRAPLYEEGDVLKAADAWKRKDTWAEMRLDEAVERMRARWLESVPS